ncbi:putative haloacid dehalogenase-like hydrolase [Actinoplanes missouriensis 431]|uniref:Putative haloacid dehalogenase-like hydrolase n=1 Tax=Actinoplanes missouriensis (strain ATCC 14538 / DSM 43046 / CBS 188.64 / JCM 3121 / NBRC 102363 / NCIMB 12654 / NRRL B-3342 / UNCC 431) TaxID=512565 RepID=I0HID6_ACTM4|nr:HAD family hydrolase [Actinoplanes missouriensis]BAL92773.1 putative haloacid dehalogenase-like hydrolase [Actinoplanes missouriensis 431]
MSAYRAVVFDFFGTLTRSVQRGPQHADIARSLGADPEAVTGVLNRTFRARACGRYGSAEATLRWVIEQAGGRPRPGAIRAAMPARIDALRADTQLRSDAVSALTAIRGRGVRTAVISDCTHELPAFLPGLPVAPLLDAQIYSVELGVCKPDPEIYLAACDRLGVAPSDCLYVGDGGSHELTGAAAVGMTPVRLAAPDLASHLVFDADTNFAGRTVRSLTDVLALLRHTPAMAV